MKESYEWLEKEEALVLGNSAIPSALTEEAADQGAALWLFNDQVRVRSQTNRCIHAWWITERSLLDQLSTYEHTLLSNGADSRLPHLFIPLQFAGSFQGETAVRYSAVDLARFMPDVCSERLGLYSAATWWMLEQGYAKLRFVGFDELFTGAARQLFKPELLPTLSKIPFLSPRVLSSPAYFADASFDVKQDNLIEGSRSGKLRIVLGRMEQSPCSWSPTTSIKFDRLHTRYSGLAFQRPVVSVLMCVKDAALTIRDSLQSLAEQTYQNLELILVDGNSQDGTQRIVREFEGLVGDFISELDEGYYDALNKAIARANGDFFLVVNGDDVLQSHTIERLVEAAVADGVDIAAAHARTMDADGRFTGDLPSFWNASAAIRCPLRHGAMLASRRLYERVGPYEADKRIVADWLWMQRAMALGASVTIVDEYLLHFRTTGISSGTSPAHLLEVDQCLKDLEPTLPEAVRDVLHAPWEVGGEKLVDLCRRFPLAGPLRQALLAAAQPKERNSNRPALSIVLAADEGPQTLKESIFLLQQQTFSNYEILVCGELSQQSKAWLHDAATKDLRIHYVAAKSSGWLKKTLWHATGDYLLFLDAKSLKDPGFLASALASATQTSSLLVECPPSGESHAVRCEDGAIRYKMDWLTGLFLNQQPRESMAKALTAREVYKASLDWLDHWQSTAQREAYCLSIFAVSAFSMFPNKVSTLAPDSVSLRSRTLREAMILCRKDGLFPTASCSDLPEQMATAASRIFTQTVIHHHRLGKNSRLRLVSDWNKALRETLLKTACATADTPEAQT